MTSHRLAKLLLERPDRPVELQIIGNSTSVEEIYDSYKSIIICNAYCR